MQKRKTQTGWANRKIRPISTRDLPQIQGYLQTESKQMGEGSPYKWKSKARVAIFIADKTDFKTQTVVGDKVGQHIMIKGSIQEEDIRVINVYESNIRAFQYISKC